MILAKYWTSVSSPVFQTYLCLKGFFSREKIKARELPYLSKKALRKKIIEQCKKVNVCPYCDASNGVVKKCGLLKISHEKFRSVKKTAEVVLNKLAEYEEVNPFFTRSGSIQMVWPVL